MKKTFIHISVDTSIDLAALLLANLAESQTDAYRNLTVYDNELDNEDSKICAEIRPFGAAD